MAIHEAEVKVYEVKHYCDKCHVPTYFSGQVFMTAPAQYQHICPNCKTNHNLSKSYPSIEYK